MLSRPNPLVAILGEALSEYIRESQLLMITPAWKPGSNPEVGSLVEEDSPCLVVVIITNIQIEVIHIENESV